MAVLGIRLRRFMCHTCDLYKPSAAYRAKAGLPEAGDFKRSPMPDYTNVACHLQSTPEFDEPRLQGVSKETNVLTSDKWHLLQAQEVADTWIIVMKTVDHPDYGKAWTVQGNAQSNASAPGRPTGSQWVFAKLTADAEIPS